MTANPRLLMVVNVDWFVVSHRLGLIRHLVASGYDVTVACAFTGREAEIRETGASVVPLALRRSGLGLLALVVEAWAIFRVVWRVRPDILHLVTVKPVLLGGCAGRLLGVPKRVLAISGLGYLYSTRTVRARLLRALAGQIYRFIFTGSGVWGVFQNRDDVAQLERAMGRRIPRYVLTEGSGVDLEVFQPVPLPQGATVVLLPARIVRDKGILEFVAAARSLRSELGSQARFVLVGGIDDASANTISEAQVLTWQKEGVIEWWGHRSDMPSTLGQAHIVCLPSYREGFPKSLIEAAACARAVVTTDVPGCRDAIEHGTTGLLAKVQDAPDLARQLARLLADPTLVESMGREGRRMAERRFSQQRVIQRHLSVYRATGDACPLLEPAE